MRSSGLESLTRQILKNLTQSNFLGGALSLLDPTPETPRTLQIRLASSQIQSLSDHEHGGKWEAHVIRLSEKLLRTTTQRASLTLLRFYAATLSTRSQLLPGVRSCYSGCRWSQLPVKLLFCLCWSLLCFDSNPCSFRFRCFRGRTCCLQ